MYKGLRVKTFKNEKVGGFNTGTSFDVVLGIRYCFNIGLFLRYRMKLAIDFDRVTTLLLRLKNS